MTVIFISMNPPNYFTRYTIIIRVCHPLDTICTRLQLSPPRFHGFFHCAKQTFQHETLRGLYKGFVPPFFCQGLYKAVIFTTSSTLRHDVLPYVPLFQPVLTPTVMSLTAGAIVGGVNAFLVTPVELVCNRLQVQYDNQTQSWRYRGAFDCIAQVVCHEGIPAMWKGLSTTIVRDSLGVAFDFAKKYIGASGRLGESTTLLTAGACGGISFWAGALSFDTVKALIRAGRKDGKYAGLISATSRLVREEVARYSSFVAGKLTAFLRGIPSAAVTFWTFEQTSKFLN